MTDAMDEKTMRHFQEQTADFWDWQALIWDQIVKPPEDVPFFVEEAENVETAVLEIGCGTGRTLIPIAEAGVDIVGLDLSSEMLAELRRKTADLPPETRSRITLVQGDMQNFDLGRRFDLVLMTYAFVFLLSPDDQMEALACIGRHLTDNGRLIFTNPDPNLDVIANRIDRTKTALVQDKEVTVGEDGRLAVWVSRSCEPEIQRITSTFIYEELDQTGLAGRRRYKTLTSRYTYRYEMEHLLALCGFQVVALYGDFKRKAFSYGDIQIWICKKEVRPG